MRKKGAIQIFAGVVALFIAVAVAGSAAWLYLTRETPPDADTLCPGAGPLGHIVVLVDATDPLNFIQRQAFDAVVRDLVERKIPKGHLVSVFVLGEDFTQGAAAVIERCNPGSGVDASQLTSNVAKLQRRYHEGFELPLLKVTDGLVATSSAKASPVLEMLQLISINAFKANAVTGEKRLIIMSDMLHNTPGFSMYKSGGDFGAFSNTDYGKRSLTQLQGVAVEIHYLMNAPHLQTRRHLKFWEEYFDLAGARIVSVTPLEG